MLAQKFYVAGLADMGCFEDIPETGATLEENASIKSQYVVDRFHTDCFADDTGLEVDALDGRPGVYSARYAGEGATYEKNVDKLLEELDGKTIRTARFRTVISLILNGKEYLFDGVVEGRIIEERRGGSGFGYDPVFVPNGYEQTFAEMEPELKNKISHRAIATQKFANFILNKD